jgi:hypothetical protein
MTKWERRCRRESQQKYRKLGPSPATILENTQVVMCVEHGMLSESEGAKILRVSADGFCRIRASVNDFAISAVEKLAEYSS